MKQSTKKSIILTEKKIFNRFFFFFFFFFGKMTAQRPWGYNVEEKPFHNIKCYLNKCQRVGKQLLPLELQILHIQKESESFSRKGPPC